METERLPKSTPLNVPVVVVVAICIAAIMAIFTIGFVYVINQKKEVLIQKVEVPALVSCPTTPTKATVSQTKAKVGTTAPASKNKPVTPPLKSSPTISTELIRSRIAEIKTPGPIEPVAPIDSIQPQ